METDYLVVGAGASGLAFADTLVAEAENVQVTVVDRRQAPGGHWLQAYPFVRLHIPSAYYGVSSLALGEDRIEYGVRNLIRDLVRMTFGDGFRRKQTAIRHLGSLAP